jgi:hypothetical protein
MTESHQERDKILFLHSNLIVTITYYKHDEVKNLKFVLELLEY